MALEQEVGKSISLDQIREGLSKYKPKVFTLTHSHFNSLENIFKRERFFQDVTIFLNSIIDCS